MATEAQIAANRKNAKKSTGPRTPEGKTAASRNSITHGFSAKHLFLTDENPAHFDILLDDLRNTYHPVGDHEEKLILRIASAQWRLDRTLSMEVQIYRGHFARRERLPAIEFSGNETLRLGPLFIADCDEGGYLLKMSRYEAALDRSINHAIRQLQCAQKARAADPAADRAEFGPGTAERTQSTPAEPPPEEVPAKLQNEANSDDPQLVTLLVTPGSINEDWPPETQLSPDSTSSHQKPLPYPRL